MCGNNNNVIFIAPRPVSREKKHQLILEIRWGRSKTKKQDNHHQPSRPVLKILRCTFLLRKKNCDTYALLYFLPYAMHWNLLCAQKMYTHTSCILSVFFGVCVFMYTRGKKMARRNKRGMIMMLTGKLATIFLWRTGLS